MVLTVSKLASRVGLSGDAIRYYERAGLLPAVERTPAGYRVFDQDAVRRLRFIKGARHLGLRLEEIRELLEVLDRGLCPCGHAEALVRRRVAELDAEIERLTEVRGELGRLLDEFPADACRDGDAASWPCEKEFIRAGGGDVRATSSLPTDA